MIIKEIISNEIPIDAEAVVREIRKRQLASWNCGRINENEKFPYLQELYSIINEKQIDTPWSFRGQLYRIHTSQVACLDYIDSTRYERISKVYSDGGCRVIPITDYTSELVAYSKSYDFTRSVYYKVCPNQKSKFIICDTNNLRGIDVCKFTKQFGGFIAKLEKEYEVLFPIIKYNIVKEYTCTPNQFNYYMRRLKNSYDNEFSEEQPLLP